MLQVLHFLPMTDSEMNFSDNTVLSVRALNEFVKRIVDNNTYLSSVTIKGEISNFTDHYKSGHLYFSIKDEEAQIKCVMFSSFASKLIFKPENGMQVNAHGRVSLFVRDGQFIFYVDKLESDGIGDLYLKYEQTKKKLMQEGLFDPSHKRPIPRYPRKIGIITSDTGAAIQDIRNIISRRYPIAEMILYPSLVQGKDAEEDLCRGIDYFSSNGGVDTLIIGRGGGSIEDLWAFNSELLARKIYSCPIPVISAVGHETDFTICDFAADLRAPTPSAAAELAVPDMKDLKRQLGNVILKMQGIINNRISSYSYRIQRCAENRLLSSPLYLIEDKRMYVERLRELMLSSMQRYTDGHAADVDRYGSRILSLIQLIFEQRKNSYIRLTSKLEALNPMAVISRGYSAVFDGDGRLIKSTDDISVGDSISISLTDGKLNANVTDKRRNDNE